MLRSIRLALLIGLLAALVAGAGTVTAGGSKIVDTQLAGLPTPGLVLAGVRGAGHAWAIADGHAKLFTDGRLHVTVEGLVLTPEGINPVTSGRAVVSCNGGAEILMSDPVPFSVPGGDATVDTTLSLPSPCLAPTIFFTSPGGAWFAVSGG
jgi:hypothetical protein